MILSTTTFVLPRQAASQFAANRKILSRCWDGILHSKALRPSDKGGSDDSFACAAQSSVLRARWCRATRNTSKECHLVVRAHQPNSFISFP
eukprot:1712213-Amphidinium_carterae.1